MYSGTQNIMKNIGSARSAIKKNYASVINRIRPLAKVLTTVSRSVRLIRATSLKLQAASSERLKLQAASIKPQAQRFKRQAASGKLLDHGSWKKFHGRRTKGLYQNK